MSNEYIGISAVLDFFCNYESLLVLPNDWPHNRSFMVFYPLFTGRPFHCYMLDKSFVSLGVSALFCHFDCIFDGKSC